MEVWNRFRAGLRALAACGAAASMLLAACGGGGGDDDASSGGSGTAVRLESAATASATIGAAGGTVTAVAADGRRYTLTVPAGALAADAAITATPIVSMGNAPLADGLRGGVRFGPSGTRFAVPATLRIEGASTAVTAGRLLGFVRSDDGAVMRLLPVTSAPGAVDVPVLHFSDVGITEALREAVAALPLVQPVDPVEEMWDTAARESLAATTPELLADMVARLHDTLLAPLLDEAAQLSGDPSDEPFRVSVVATWSAWRSIIDIVASPGAEREQLLARLGDRVPLARARTGAVLAVQVDQGRSACLAPAPVGVVQMNGLEAALRAQIVADQFDLAAADLGLDADTVARRLNDCARVAFVPRALPSFEVGRQVSLDTQAELLFAQDPNVGMPSDLEFNLSSADASIATPRGFGSVQGGYTSVVTPSAANPVFTVRACLVVTMANGSRQPGVMCGRQTVPGDQGVILAGTIDLFADLNRVDTLVGEMSLRVRANPDGSFTVVEALGSYRIRETISGNCTPAGGGPLVTRSLSASVDGIVTGARVFREPGQPFVLEGTSRETGSFQELRDDCSVATQTVDRTRAIGPLPFFRIERDAQGVPLFIDIGFDADAILGRLVRQ
jgi:hypothetical protein